MQSAIQASIANLEKLPHVASVGSLITSKIDPFTGKIALVTVQYDTQAQDVGLDSYDLLTKATAPAAQAGVELAYGGAVVDYSNRTPSGNADLIGLLAAVIILLFAFGSVVAMGLPILTALFGLGVGVALINVVASFTTIGSLAPTLATMIGLGVGIDYSLFIVTRYRENIADGMTIEAAAGHSVATAGQAVLFAGCTVVIAICGLAISGIPYVAKLGYMAALVVAVMMLAAITLLPAVIGLVGKNIDRWRVPSLIHHRDGAGARSGRVDLGALGHDGRPSRVALRRSLGVTILLVLAWPVLSMRLGESDDGNLPTSTTQRQAYDLIAQGFGPGTNGPLLVVVALPSTSDPDLLTNISAAISKTPERRRGAPAGAQPEHDRSEGRRDHGVPDDVTGERADVVTGPAAAEQRAAGGHRHERRAGLRGRAHGHLHRHRRPDQQPAPVLHRRGRAVVVPAADAGVPLDPHPAHRGGR